MKRVLIMVGVFGLIYLHMLNQGKTHEEMERNGLFNNQPYSSNLNKEES